MLRLSLLLGALALLASSPEAQTCTTSWAAAQSGAWSDDANWTDGAPDAGDTACITASGVYTVTLDRTQALAGLVVGGASGLQTLAMDGTLAPLGGGTIGASGRVEIGTAGLRDVTGTLDVEGTLVHRNGAGLLTQGGTVDVGAGGTLRVRTSLNSVSMGSATAGDRSRIVVRGTLLFDAEGQTPRGVNVRGDLDLAGGTIAVTDGRVDLSTSGTWTGGTFDVPEGGYLWFLNGGYEVTGTLSGTPAGQVQFSSGVTLSAGAGGATLDVGGAGIEIFPGSGATTYFRSAGGAFTNTGRVFVTGNGLWLNGVAFRNEGQVDARTTLRFEEGTTFDNASGATLALLDGGGITGGPEGGTLRTAGRVVASLDANTSGRSTVSVPVDVQGGTLAAEQADLFFSSQGTLRDVTVEVADGLDLTFARGGGSDGVYQVSGTLSGTPAGFFGFGSGARAEAASGGATFDVGGTGLAVSPGSGQTTFFASAGGAFTNEGLLTAQGNGLWVEGVTLRNQGALDVRTPMRMLGEARIVNARGATLRLVDGGGVSEQEGSGRIVNRGDLLGVLDQRTSAQSTVRVPVDVENARVAAEGADLFFQGGGTWTDAAVTVAEGLDMWLSGAGFVLEGTFSGSSEGELLFTSGGTFTAASGGAVLDVSGNGVEVFPGSGQATFFDGSFTNAGRLVVNGNGLWMQGASLLNEGDFTVRTALRLNEGATVRNTATTTFAGNSNVTGDGSGGTFTNEALALKTEGGSTSFNGYLRSVPGSEIRALNGRLALSGEDPANFGAGTRLTLAAQDSVSIFTSQFLQGTLSPGVPGAEIVAVNHDGVLAFDATEGNARLVIDVGPDGAGDLVNTENTVTLGGTLVVRLQDGYTPLPGDEWTIIRDLRNNLPRGAFSSVEVVGGTEEVSFVVDATQPGAVILRAASGVAVRAPLAEVPEGQPASFVLSHPATDAPFTIAYETGGSATRFADYTLGATRGIVRAQPNTTETVVSLFPRRDTDTTEGTETVVFRVIDGGDASPVPGATEAAVAILDGPSSDALTLETVVPARGANIGTVSPTILGTGLGDGATARLVGPGGAIEASLVEAADGQAGVGAVFDLADVATGTYDVVVEHGGQAATLTGGFEVIEAPRVAALWADIAGPVAPRSGRWSTYTVTLGNDTDADVHDVVLVLRITNGAEIELLEGVRDLEDAPAAEQPLVMEGLEGSQVIPLWFKKLPARSSGQVRLRARPSGPLGIGDDFGVAYELYPPDNSNPFTWSGDFDDAAPFNYGMLWGALDAYVEAYPPTGGVQRRDQRLPASSAAGIAGGQGECPPDGGGSPPPLIQDLPPDQLLNRFDQGDRFNGYRGEVAPSTSTTVTSYASFSLEQLLSNGTRLAGYGVGGLVGGGLFTMWDIRSKGKRAESIMCERRNEGSLPNDSRLGGGEDGPCGPPNGPPAGPPTGPPGGAGPGGFGGGACGQIGGSFDPNDKLGPIGQGPERFYDPSVTTTPYVVRFENLNTATFPAQEVVIVDTLDASRFDLSTFSLGPIRWGDNRRVVPPSGAQTFQTEVSLAPEFDATLLITAALDRTSGRATWHFATLDNQTGDLPEDGTVGFLPPNVMSPEGEGSVSFTLGTRDDLSTGDRVRNGAEIVFDVNEPIVTPVWSNTVDITAPVSTVDPLSAVETNPVTITVSSTDAGSGTHLYGLFAAQDGGDFGLVELSYEPTFEVDLVTGSSYGFYALAIDQVGNAEGFKAEAEATTMVAVDAETGPDGPLALTLASPRPNPARGLVRLRFGLPSADVASVRVLDALGREVAVLSSGEAASGWHVAEWQPRVASGVYVVELRAGDEVRHERLTVVR